MAKRKLLTGTAPDNNDSDDTFWNSDLDFTWDRDDPTLSMTSFNPEAIGARENIVLPPEAVCYSEDTNFEGSLDFVTTGGKWGAFAFGTA
ncbi:MAG TPA: hypothetical protein VGD13_09215, partial [Xanthobacteraceae bacterium]